MVMIGKMSVEKVRYKAKRLHSSKLRLHQQQEEQGPHLDPQHLPQFISEEEEKRETETMHADSWICGSLLEHVPVATKAVAPPTRAEPRARVPV